jgi:glycosyltransferase involved in cell wall biosynthesis
MKSTHPTFSVVIPATRPSSLPAAIASIYFQTISSWELLIVGQGDDSAVRTAAASASRAGDTRIRYVHLSAKGLSRARNAGLLAARGDLIAMIDDDCEASPDLLEVVRDAFDSHPEVDLIGGSMLAPAKPAGRGFGRCPHWNPVEYLFDSDTSREAAPADAGIVGGNFAVRRELVGSVGLFDEALGVGGDFPASEDSDYFLRVLAAGGAVLCTPRAVVHHSDGWRFGYRTVLRHQRQRALGNGALAAKRAMVGDKDGRQELRDMLGRFQSDLLRLQKPQGIWYLPSFLQGYRRCIRHYTVDRAGLLRHRRADAVEAVVGALENGR